MMYKQIKDLPQNEQIEKIARTLVSVKSVNGSNGETDIAGKLEEILRSFPYFKEHPDFVWTQTLKKDVLGRKNVFAFLESGNAAAQTVIYHGHMDTVGINDFGAIADHALDPDFLQHYFKQYDRDSEVREDAASGDWLFGRGALDMKSGDAVHLSNLLYYSEHRDLLKGHLLVMFNPVEENDHRGVMEAVDELLRLKQARHLDYRLAINADFVSPLYKGDPHRYIYTGSAGKLLGCFYIRGRETHVGETLAGIDPTLIASRINDALNNNMQAAERIPGEVVLPPSCLYLRDRKTFYNVQTAGSAHLYFNYFLYERSPEAVLEQLKETAVKSCSELAHFLGGQYQIFADNVGLKGGSPNWQVDVLTYDEFVRQIREKGIDIEKLANSIVANNPDGDFRSTSYKIIEALEHAADDNRPKVVVFFAPPYCPHNYLRQTITAERRCDEWLDRALDETAKESGESFAKKRFFPYLADGSYLAMSESADETRKIIENFPGWGLTYDVPLEKIRALNIPVLNMGVYGKRAHTWMERIYKPYSYSVLPKLIRRMTEYVLNEE